MISKVPWKPIVSGLCLITLLGIFGWVLPSQVSPQSGKFTDLGQVLTESFVTDLVEGADGNIYGGTFSEGHLFVFNLLDNSITDLGVPPDQNGILALTWGIDGKLYGGGWGSTIWNYDPNTDTFSALAKVPEGRRIIGMTTGLAGIIYIGTEPEQNLEVTGRLFAFNPYTSEIAEIGAIEGENSIGYGLTTDADGKIFGGTLKNGRFFVYDPLSGVFTDKGQPILSEDGVIDLAVGDDGNIYGGTRPNAHLFLYNPSLNSFTDIGISVTGHNKVDSLFAKDHKIYGGTGNWFGRDVSAHLFEYDT